MQPLIYLASPYTKFNGGAHAAFDKVVSKAGELMLDGLNVFCPISHTHPIQEKIGDPGADWWLGQDFAMLDRCDQLWVYQMPGWEDSYGVQKEIERATQRGIPIAFIAYREQS